MSESHGSGGDLSLDFHNTVTWVGDEAVADETLHTYEDLLSWTAQAAILPPETEQALRRAARDREAADRTLRRAHELRRTIHGLFASIAADASPEAKHVASFNRFLETLPLRVEPVDGGEFDWAWWDGDVEPSAVLRPIVWAAASLLRGDDVGFVKSCDNDQCGWLFVDRSRRRNRRWCTMRDCGNRAKARRYYERHRRHSRG